MMDAAYHKAWRDAHLESRRAQDRAYWAAHREQKRIYNASYGATHPDKNAAAQARYRKTARGKIAALAHRMNRRADGKVKISDMRYVVDLYGGRCVYCDGPYQVIDHILPVRLGGKNNRGNLAPACQKCNGNKGAKTVAAWLNGAEGGAV